MRTANEANRRYFHGAYHTGEHGWAIEEPSPFILDFLKRLKRWVPGGTLLDIGCGEGRHSIAAARLGFEVTAIDFEPLALARARRFARIKGVREIVFRKADVFRLPFRDGCFDVALDCGCLHHQRKSDWPAYVAGLLRVLKPRGFYVLNVFSPKFRMFRGRRRPWHIGFGAYRRCFTRKGIVELFRRDFEIRTLTEERERDGGFWNALLQRRGTAQAKRLCDRGEARRA
jgi:ubiquinone/menaquinone biosynthesis C-methylase UbiE